MGFVSWLITHFAPLFLVTSPITSYADQIHSIYKTRSSAGFSLDIPLIMLLASILKIFYWQGERYDISLLIQAMIMIVIHTTLLHVALVNRPSDAMPINHKPFEAASNESTSSPRPYSFWQWRSRKPYWQFLGYYVGTLVVLQLIFGVTPSFVKLQGMVALSIEALLPIPQILANQRNKSCKGFRISLLINWLFGDALKMMFFFMAKSDIPLAFKLCGTFQAMCDCYLGIQYYMFGNGVEHDDVLLRKE